MPPAIIEPPSPPVAAIEAAIRQGDRQLAHDLCVRLVAAEPENEQAWLWFASTAETTEEVITGLSQAARLNAENETTRQALYQAMRELLERDAFLAYEGENERVYHVRTAADFTFAHPKDRSAIEPYPPAEQPPAQRALGWLGLALLGLLPAGLGSLIFAPLAMLAALRLLRQPLAPSDRVRAQIVFGSAVVLWLAAVVLAALILMHF
jgi:hypothetical protein